MNRVLSALVLLTGMLFIFTGVQWLVVPADVAPQFGLTLDGGRGLSSQVGDMSGFFLTLGLCALLALTLKQRVWYYPAILLLSLTALGRCLAWLVHDAAFAVDLIAPEVLVSILYGLAARRLADK